MGLSQEKFLLHSLIYMQTLRRGFPRLDLLTLRRCSMMRRLRVLDDLIRPVQRLDLVC
jgi:hypothetical protein